MQRLVKFNVLGQEFPLYTDAPEEDVQEILALVKKQIAEHERSGPHYLPPNKLAILASLNMASEYIKLKRDFEKYRRRVDEQLGKLSEKIEKSL